MVDISRPATVGPVEAADRQGERHDREKPEKRRPRGRREESDVGVVAFIMGIPESDMTPKVREALSIIMGEFDRMRDKMELAQEREGYLLDLADQHPLLPLPNRRALTRQLSRLIGRAEAGTTVGSFVFLRIENLEDLWTGRGHQASEAALIGAAEVLREMVRASDVAGSIGGSNFGVILTLTWGQAAEEKALDLARGIGDRSVLGPGSPVRLRVAWGLREFSADDTCEKVIFAAAADLLKRRRAGGGRENGMANGKQGGK